MRTHVRVDLGRIAANFRAIREFCPRGTKILAVVKANAYGHGAVPVARTLEKAGCRHLAVACSTEGAALRKAGCSAEILLLSAFTPGEEDDLADLDLTPVLHSVELIEAWRAAARRMNRRLPCHLNFDTGMNRLGLRFSDALAERLLNAAELEVRGICTHLAAAEDFEDDTASQQLQTFERWTAALRLLGLEFGERHFANSAAIAYGRHSGSSMVRPGLALYGYVNRRRGAGGVSALGLRPALEWRAKVLAVHDAAPGERVGYDGAFRVGQRMRLATLGVGYGDGFRRAYGPSGSVLFGERRLPIVGRISMDLTTVDATAVAVQPGDEVVLLGEKLDAAALSDHSGVTSYEILSGIGSRAARCYGAALDPMPENEPAFRPLSWVC